MTRDYATKRPFKKHKPSAPTAYSPKASELNFPAWAVLSVGFLLGALVMLGYHHWQSTSAPVQEVIASIPEPKSTVPQPQTKEVAKEIERFDFYTLLPNMSVEIPDIEPAKASTINVQYNYKLQVASFKDASQARNLQSKLKANGFSPEIQSAPISSGDVWHRVYLGPFQTHQQAINSQKTLLDEQLLKSLILKIKV